MAIVFRLLADGAFVVGDTETRRTFLAEAGSSNALKASAKPTQYGTFAPAYVAANMAIGMRDGHPARIGKTGAYDRANWRLLNRKERKANGLGNASHREAEGGRDCSVSPSG